MKIKALLQKYRQLKAKKSAQTNLVLGFTLYLLIGFALLLLPICHRHSISLLDNLFTAVSAVSTTGLTTVSVNQSYNFFGQFVIVFLIQVGGIGYMTLTTYYLIFTTKQITKWHHRILGCEFSIPSSIKIHDFIKSVIVFTLIMEVLGILFLYPFFSNTGLDQWDALWFAIFHSISSFCTAGFSLYDNSFESFSNHYYINIVLSILSILGSLGFIVVTDIWYRITKKTYKLSFTTKIIFYGFASLLTFGTLIIYFSEPSLVANSQIGFMEVFFQAMTAMTTVGFNTVPILQLKLPILLLIIFLMYIGASPSGTAGGLKITTLTAMIAIVKSHLFGEKKVTFLNKIIPYERLYVATSTFILYTSIIFLFTFLLSYTEKLPFEDILFEVASALGTVGLSIGISAGLSWLGKIMVIFLMFIGRVGVLTFGFSLILKGKKQTNNTKEDLAI